MPKTTTVAFTGLQEYRHATSVPMIAKVAGLAVMMSYCCEAERTAFAISRVVRQASCAKFDHRNLESHGNLTID